MYLALVSSTMLVLLQLLFVTHFAPCSRRVLCTSLFFSYQCSIHQRHFFRKKRRKKILTMLGDLSRQRTNLDARNWSDDDPLITHYIQERLLIANRVKLVLFYYILTTIHRLFEKVVPCI